MRTAARTSAGAATVSVIRSTTSRLASRRGRPPFGLPPRNSSVAATVTPSVRIVPATAVARARVSLLVDLADDEAVVPVVDQGQVGPAAGDQRAAAQRADRLDGHPGDDLRGAHAAEAYVHRWCAGVQEHLQLGERDVGGRPSRAQLPALGAAFATGVRIAGYTVVDALGAARLRLPPTPPDVPTSRTGRALPAQLRPVAVTGLVGGVVSLAAVAIGALLGAVFLGERLGHARAFACVVVVVGIVLISLRRASPRWRRVLDRDPAAACVCAGHVLAE